MNSLALYQKISQALTWNAGEAIAYHLLLITHQLALFLVLPHNQYGTIGTAFSLLYLAVWLIDLGLESLLALRFSTWSNTRQSVHSFMQAQLVPNMLFILGTISSLLFFYQPYTSFILLIGTAAVCEYIRRLCKAILLLLFDNRLVALAEAVFMFLYLSLVWSSYAYRGARALTIYTTIIPLIISSLIGTAICFYGLRRWYYTLPDHAAVHDLSWHKAARLRLFPYINMMSMLLFSSNFLVPLFAAQFGASHAGLLKLASTLVHSITIILQRTFGNTCRAILAHLKMIDSSVQHDMFMTISTYLYQALYGLMIFCFINHRFIARICGAADQHGMALFVLFFIINFLDNFIITLEKLYEFKERSDILSLFNVVNIVAIIGITLTATSWSSPITLLILIALTRLSIVALTICFTCLFYRIMPHRAVQPTFILSAMAASLLFLMSVGT